MIPPLLGKLLTIGLALVLGLVAASEEEPPDLGITGSKHDFRRFGLLGEKRCLPCHAPSRDADKPDAPKWDQSVDAGRSYKLYGGSPGVPGSGTLLCVSCHDGSAAIDAFGGTDGDVYMADIADEDGLVGASRDLSSDHPVGVYYPDFDRDYVSKVTVEGEGLVPLPDGRVECVSCHDVHGLYGFDHLLVKSNVRSALCLTCHRK